MEMTGLLFYLLSAIIIVFSLGVVLATNPIYSALLLAMTMVVLAFVYFVLQAYFIAGVQLAVYAGAVMVLFLMVLMLFDLKKEKRAFTRGFLQTVLKIGSAAFLCGAIVKTVQLSTDIIEKGPEMLNQASAQMGATKNLAILLYSKYMFAFEALGLLLLLIAIGVVSVARGKGGTHARS